MDTVSIGDKFEKVCFVLISNALHKKELGLIPDQCKVFQKKGYYSKDRKKNIIFDLSIEVWPPNSENFTLLYIIECKDYSSKPIPVDDIEEFYAKVIQVSGINVKGVFITSNTFQSGAYTYANSKGMMLIEVNNNLTYNIILHKTNLFKEKKLESNFSKKDHTDLPKLLKDRLAIQKTKRAIEKIILQNLVRYLKDESAKKNNYRIQIFSRKHLEEITSQILNSFNPNAINTNEIFRFEEFISYLSQLFDLTIIISDIEETDKNNRPILSYCSFVDKKIVIDTSIKNSTRYKFILAHEIGHFFLHNKLQIDQNAYEKLSDSKFKFRLDRYLLKNERNWVEWQANQFAASLIMPKKVIYFHFSEIQDKIGLRPGSRLYVDEQKCNQDSFHHIVRGLATIFQTTKTSIIYRLDSLGLLNENYKIKHHSHTMNISQILKNVMGNDE